MLYDHLTPEQSQRAEALHAAATAFGSPTDPLDDYLIRAGQWIVTGQHEALHQSENEVIYEGGGVDQEPESDTAEDTPVSVGKDFSEAQSGPVLDDVETTQP